MKFYLFITMEFNDDTKPSKSIYEYDSLNEAVGNFHKQLGGWMLKENVKHILAMVINENGGVHETEVFDNLITPTVEPEVASEMYEELPIEEVEW